MRTLNIEVGFDREVFEAKVKAAAEMLGLCGDDLSPEFEEALLAVLRDFAAEEMKRCVWTRIDEPSEPPAGEGVI